MALTPPTELTFADMLAKLRTRVKIHATLGSAPALEDILEEANEYVFDQLDNSRPWQSTLTLVANTASYPFLTDGGLPVARGSVQSVWIEQGDSCRVLLPQGIRHTERADTAIRGIPERYDTNMVGGTDDAGQFNLEVWPTPDDAYVLHIDHNRVLSRFSEAADKPSAPSRLVLTYAIAIGKAHYQNPDADLAGQTFSRMLSSEKDKQRENRRFIPGGSRPRNPQVVSTAGGFKQVN